MSLQLLPQIFMRRQFGILSFGIFCGLFGLNFAHVKASEGASQVSMQVCEATLTTKETGRFPVDPIDEASGLALSATGSHFFVTNDSGDLPRFFRTRLDGTAVEDFRMKEMRDGKLKAWKPFDVEELALGPCPKGLNGDCVVLADIGDNRDRRKGVELGFFRVEDLPNPPTGAVRSPLAPVDVTLAKKIRFTYPDGPRNAEAFAVLSPRYGVIVTKQQDRKSRASQPAGVYVVDFETSLVEKVATWDVPSWVRDQGLGGLVTGMSVFRSPHGSGFRFVLLTYRDVIEVNVTSDLLVKTTWPPRPWSISSRSIFKVDVLEQQEAISFDKSGAGFYYTTEAPLAILGFKYAAIRYVEKMACL